MEGVLKQYMTHVKPAYQSYIAPCMAHADIIVPRGGENKVAIHLIVQHVHKQLQLVSYCNMMQSLQYRVDFQYNRMQLTTNI